LEAQLRAHAQDDEGQVPLDVHVNEQIGYLRKQ